MAVKLLKLISGEVIIADVTELDGKFTIENPLTLEIVQTGPKEAGIAMVPWWMLSNDTSFTLDSRNIMFTTEPQEEIKADYCKKFSKIITPGGNGHIHLA